MNKGAKLFHFPCITLYELDLNIDYFLLFQPFFVERVFHIFDKDDNGSISLQEFIDAMHQFAGQSPDDKIKFLFKVYDIDGKIFYLSKFVIHLLMMFCILI